MNSPKVSIGMPVYNGELFIREALDSLLAQTFTDFELIISDNCSTDGTEAICREYAEKDSRIRYVRQAENRGATANFKFVLDEAVGEYFMWAAADDRRSAEFLRLANSVLDSNQQFGLVFSWQETRNLLTGEITKSETGYTTSRRKLFRILFRIHQGNPCLIYGMHRISLLRQIKIESFDYFDLYLTHWYELNSSISVLPLYLFTAGIYGERIPYSIEGGTLIQSKEYLLRNKELLQWHFSFVISSALYVLLWWLIKKITNNHNLQIRASRRLKTTQKKHS